MILNIKRKLFKLSPVSAVIMLLVIYFIFAAMTVMLYAGMFTLVSYIAFVSYKKTKHKKLEHTKQKN
ncbi:hypothetical protein GCM10009111_33140 [Colwellia asteriadis]|uniref:Uncharacterized protein n=1 Tax=Colwellia asteriadis TaxID=517723 RepID=A0ABN1LAX6_9GAMM